MRGEPRGFRRDQQIAPRRWLDFPDLGEVVGPCLSCDPQKFKRVPPIFVELFGHQAVERVPRDIARHHVVHQSRQIAGQRQSRGRPADHQRRRNRAVRPGRDEFRKRQPAVELGEFWRDVERRRSAELVGVFGERQFVLVDIAERDDARQHRCVRLQLLKENFARHPHRAPRRQIERRLGQPRGIRGRRESLDEPAVDQRANHAAQKRYGDGNAENAHGHPDSRSGANIGRD
jgi:hypothetical protein